MDLRDPTTDADAVAAALGLAPHPEGGRYRETWRDAARPDGSRGAGTAIHFLLAAGERSRWHRVTDAAELWLWQAGWPLDLRVAGGPTVRLGPDVGGGEALHALVPAGAWQCAAPAPGSAWALVACVVCPAFEFAAFEMAPEGWEPPRP